MTATASQSPSKACTKCGVAYGITGEDVQRLDAQQDGRCAICRRSFDQVPRHVDHDHTTGVVRGLLCGSCNKALGLMRDDPAVLSAAAAYLIDTRMEAPAWSRPLPKEPRAQLDSTNTGSPAKA